MPTEPRDDELEQVEEQIDEARRTAEEAGTLEGDEPKYHESGTVGRDLDDQTATPM